MKIDGWCVCAGRVGISKTDQSRNAIFILRAIRKHHEDCCLMRDSAFKYEHS
jgi:hypothetical protein